MTGAGAGSRGAAEPVRQGEERMAATYEDVVLSPARDGDTVVFTGTDRNERVSFDDPHQLQFNVHLNLAGGNDQLIGDEFDILNAEVGTGTGADYVDLAANLGMAIDAGTGDDRLFLFGGDGPVDARGGPGDDHIDADGLAGVTVHGGPGDDRIRSDGSG